MDDFKKALYVRKYLINTELADYKYNSTEWASNNISCHMYKFQTQELSSSIIARVCTQGDKSILDDAKIIGLMLPQTELELGMYPYLQELFGSFFPMDLTVEMYAEHPFGDYVVCIRTECYRGLCIIIDSITGEARVPVYYLSDLHGLN
jgi:hypothetical protein